VEPTSGSIIFGHSKTEPCQVKAGHRFAVRRPGRRDSPAEVIERLLWNADVQWVDDVEFESYLQRNWQEAHGTRGCRNGKKARQADDE
jgi:hypothetical protein